MARYKILSVSNDKSLLDSRTAVLEHGGYAVVATLNAADALKIIASQAHKFDVVVLGHTIALEQRQRLAAAAKGANAKVVVTCGADASNNTPADAYVEALAWPQELLAGIASVLPKRAAGASGQRD